MTEKINSFELKKTKYFSAFAQKRFSTMKVLAEGGILGDSALDEKGSWRNISEHCLTTAVGGDVLAEALGVGEDYRKKLSQALLLQDWYKRREIEARRSMSGGDAYEKTSAEDKEYLQKLGISEEIIRIAGSNIPDTANPEDWEKRSVVEKIAHYMDMITSQSTFMPYRERVKPVLARQGDREFLDHFKPRYGGKNLHEVQSEVVPQEEADFAKTLGITPEEIIPFLYKKLAERISGS